MTDSAKSVLITGASRGIGAATALGAAARGYHVTIGYRSNRDAAEQVAAGVREQGRQALIVQANVCSEADTVKLFEAHDNTFGQIDAVVNNAGILSAPQEMADYSLDRLRRIFDTNILGAFLTAREAVRRMSTTRGGAGGSLVNVSSVASRLGAPNEYIDYAASKGAIDSMTLGLAKEVADQGIRVNAVRPGLIYTDIHASGGRPDRVDNLSAGIPMRRGGTAQEVADAILWLISAQSAYVTGTFLDVAGGR